MKPYRYLKGYKDKARQMWRKRAPDYDFQNDFHSQLCEQLVAIAHMKPGRINLLDVTSDTGTVAHGQHGRLVLKASSQLWLRFVLWLSLWQCLPRRFPGWHAY